MFLELKGHSCLRTLMHFFSSKGLNHNQALNLTGKIMRFYGKASAGSSVWRPAGQLKRYTIIKGEYHEKKLL